MPAFASKPKPAALAGWVLVGLLSAAYLALSTRFPIWNFDDVHYYEFYKSTRWEGLRVLFFGTDIPEEYRTYSFSRCLQFVLLKLVGDRPIIFFGVMAVTHLVSSRLIYLNIRNLAADSKSFSAEGFGCSLIWLFSPFSIVGTFHHFSYLLMPFSMLMAYIFFTQSRSGPLPVWRATWLSTLLILICLSGEATLPALLAFLIFNLVQKARRRFSALQMAIAVSTLFAHHAWLDQVNSYATRTPRFSISLGELGVSAATNLRYFVASVGSLVAQGLNVNATSFEPYYPGLPIYSFAWKHVSLAFLVACAVLVAAMLAATKLFSAASKEGNVANVSACKPGISRRNFLIVGFFVLSLWALYLGMTVAGAKLYGGPFALQIRYGYVVIPASLCLIFLASRIWPVNRRVREFSWAIPSACVVFWLASQIIVAPRNAAQNDEILNAIAESHARGVRILTIEHPNFIVGEARIRTFGITNPFIHWGDSPFQQDWTTEVYLRTFLGVSIYRGDLVAWGDRNLIMVDGQLNLDRKLYASIGAASLGRVVVDYPVRDIRINYELQRAGSGVSPHGQPAGISSGDQ